MFNLVLEEASVIFHLLICVYIHYTYVGIEDIQDSVYKLAEEILRYWVCSTAVCLPATNIINKYK